MIEARPELAAAIEPLLKVLEAVEKQIADLDRKVMRLARNDVQVRRFMTAPGIGPITALNGLLLVGISVALVFEIMKLVDIQIARRPRRDR